MKKIIVSWIAISAVFCLSACGNDEEAQEILQHTEDSTMPISYETGQESEQRLAEQNGRNANEGRATVYPQERNRHHFPEKSGNADPHFYNEQAMTIESKLEAETEIVLAQVHTTETRVTVGLMIDKKYDDSAKAISRRSYKQVEKLAPGKEVQVYISDVITDKQKQRIGAHVKSS